ncbi:MAG: transposase [Cryobacterium sp.]|nr:transposase [Cryobacterium sp.]
MNSAASRLSDLALSMAAALVAEGCNLGFAPVLKKGHPSLNRRRLSHVAQNYLRAETISAANGRLIDAQASIDTAPGIAAKHHAIGYGLIRYNTADVLRRCA